MSMGPRLDLRQSQSLVMTPQLQQAIRLLALSNLEVETFLAEEIEKNPLLEGGAPDEGDAPIEKPAAVEAEPATDLSEPKPDDADFSEDIFHHDGVSDGAGATSGSASEDGVDFDSFAGAAETLTGHLTAQAGEVLTGIDLAIAIQLIDAIDESGYLTVTLFETAQRLSVPMGHVEAVLKVIHGFEPTGVGARSLSECLSLQAQEADRYDPCMKVLLDNLELLAGGKIAHLQRLCGVDDEDMSDMIRELRSYDPKPGLRFGSAPVVAVTPDLFVNRTAKGWRVEINSTTLPRVLVDRRYHAELASSAHDRASKTWLSDALASANWLIKALDQRQRTIIKVATEIVKAQEGFFLHGVAHLKPLTLRMIADAVSLHESTVSRVTSNKYLNCSRGTFELKYFFTSGIGSSDGGEASSALAVKAAIRTLILGEAANAILSDDTLVDLLREKGFDIARRTVAKYREALGLGSSVQRRRARAIETKAA
ncbi:RNA polymerase factor sigma-54 [soil metagenome]